MRIVWIVISLLLTPILSAYSFAEVNVPHTFSNGERADANQVNENFSALAANLNRIVIPETIEDPSLYFPPKHLTEVVYTERYSREVVQSDGSRITEWEVHRRPERYEVISAEEGRYRYHTQDIAPDGSIYWEDSGDFNVDARGIWYSYHESPWNPNDEASPLVEVRYDGPYVSLPLNARVNQHWSNTQAGLQSDKGTNENQTVRMYVDFRSFTAIEDISVEAGEFSQCLKITQIRPQYSRIDIRWLCPKVGLVKLIRSRESGDRITELQSYKSRVE